MMDRLRSPMQAFAVTAFLISTLSFAGLGMSHAGPSNVSQSAHGNGQPCNAICEAYMTWSHRVTAMFRPSRPLQTSAAHHRTPPRMMVHHAPRTRHPALNSFAQWPVQGDATQDPASTPPAAETPQTAEAPRAAETLQAGVAPQAEVAAARPVDQIADRFPAIREFMTARPAGTDAAARDPAKDAADSPVATLADAFPATQGTGTVTAFAPSSDVRLVAALLLALGSLTALRLWRRVGGRRALTESSPGC